MPWEIEFFVQHHCNIRFSIPVSGPTTSGNSSLADGLLIDSVKVELIYFQYHFCKR